MTEAAPPDQPRTAKPARARSLVCPNCGGPIKIRASGISISAVCPSCGAVLDVSTAEIRLIAEARARTREPLIPIGWPGTLAGTEWLVVGYQVRSSEGGTWEWEEYLLFNPYRGFRFLAQDHGDWTLYGMLRRDVQPGSGGRPDAGDGRRYLPQEPVVARTDYVLGEFYWRVRVGDTVSVREYVDPPYVLVEERDGGEIIFSRGRRLDPALVKTAFALRDMPKGTGASGVPLASHPRLWPVALMALFVLIVLGFLPFGVDHDRVVLTQNFRMTAADQDRTLPGVDFDLPDAGGNLELTGSADPHGGLLLLDIAIAARGGDRRWDTRFRMGNLIGGGTQTGTATFAAIPGGAYTLLAKPHSSLYEFGAGTTIAVPPAIGFSIVLRRHVVDTGLFFLAALAILAWPAIALLVRWLRRIGHMSG